MIFDSTQNAASNFFNDAKNAILRDTAHAFGENLMLNWQDSIPPYSPRGSMQAVGTAKTYWDARKNGRVFTYSQTTFLSDPGNPVNDENGNGKIDCSTYMHLVLRGIDYANSPYADKIDGAYPPNYTDYTPKPVQTNISYPWADDSLRCSNTLTNTALTAKPGKLARTAAEIAKYYAAAGRIFPYTDDTKGYVRPGDLIFFRNRGSETDRFNHIHHIGMVSEQEGKYYNVTSGREAVVVISPIETRRHDREIAFIARPFYEREAQPEAEPFNYLNSGAWTLPEGDTKAKKSDGTPNHVIATTNLSAGTIWTHTDGTDASDNSTFTLVPTSSPLYLPAGTYRLSGAPCYFDNRQSLHHIRWALRLNLYPNDSPHMTYTGIGYNANDDMTHGIVRAEMSTDNHLATAENPNPRPRICDRGSGAEFTLDSGKWFSADIFIAKHPDGGDTPASLYSNTSDSKDIWQPKLIRIG